MCFFTGAGDLPMSALAWRLDRNGTAVTRGDVPSDTPLAPCMHASVVRVVCMS